MFTGVGKEVEVNKVLVALVLVCVFGMVVVGGELSGRVDFTFNVDPNRVIFSPQAALILEYYLSGWTFGMVSEFGSSWREYNGVVPLTIDGIGYRASGLEDITFGVRGALGAFHLASYMFFGNNTPEFSDDPSCGSIALYPISIGVRQPRFLAWKNLLWTSIAGVDLWAMWGIDAPVSTLNTITVSTMTTITKIKPMDIGNVAIGPFFGSMFGAHGVVGKLEVWAEVSFGAGHLIGLMPYWGYDLDYIASTWYYCDWSFGFYGDCSVAFDDLWVIVSYPLGCASLFSELFLDCSGFEFVSFAVRDIDLGVGWFYIDDLKVRFETDSKSVWLDLELTVPEMFCIQPHVSWDLDLDDRDSDTVIDGITLVGLTAEYSWDGITFLFAERFANPELGYSEYASITTDARLWSRVSEKEPSTYCEPNCRLLCVVDEAFGIEVDSDACCGGGMFGGVYVFFDHDLEDESLFDWFGTRLVVEYGIGPSFVFGMTGYFHHSSSPMLGFSFSYTWGTLRIFDHAFFDCLDEPFTVTTSS